MKIKAKLITVFHILLFRICFPVLHLFYTLIKQKTSNRVLVISLNYLGDVLIATPAIRGLKKLQPNIQIDILIKKSTIGIVQNNPDISNIFIESTPYSQTVNTPLSFFNFLASNYKVLASLCKRNYDFVFDFTGSFESAFLSALLGKKKRFGLCWRPHFKSIFNGVVDGYAKPQHLRFINCEIIEKAGFKLDRSQCNYILIIPEDVNKWSIEFIQKLNSKLIITLAPFAGWKQKEWNLRNFIDLSLKLADTGAKILFIGSQFDSEKLIDYKNYFNDKLLNMCGKTSLIESAALIKHSNLFIGLDSSQSHIADAMHTKSVIIFGPTNPMYHQLMNNPKVKIVYKKLSCSSHVNQKYCHENCFSFTCPNNHECMNSISIDEVFNTTIDFMRSDVRNLL